ncbi:hypothetical protein MAR_007347 [Mya arenaria]|uniref:Uncharacterized protein n=1 Tax=Mya arenaria TaxID=6604 RepID=A0ABY7DB15_MYAAR|nr:hypothetical protein MAR_007347 [Mya arenaria]
MNLNQHTKFQDENWLLKKLKEKYQKGLKILSELVANCSIVSLTHDSWTQQLAKTIAVWNIRDSIFVTDNAADEKKQLICWAVHVSVAMYKCYRSVTVFSINWKSSSSYPRCLHKMKLFIGQACETGQVVPSFDKDCCRWSLRKAHKIT